MQKNMHDSLRLSKSVVGTTEAEALSRVILEDGYLGMGREVQRFEVEIAAYLGVPADAVACVGSGTAGLHLAVEAVTRPGDEVLVQSLTYVASFQAISAARAVPVACEVSSATLTIDLEDAARRVTEHTRAIMPVHYASNPSNLEAIYRFAERHGLRVIEDAAHAFGCTHQGRRIGSFGDVVCFSFDGIKNITSGEGGAVVTRDAVVAERIRDARLLGVERDTTQRYSGGRSWEFDVKHQGYRYHMSNLFAAIGRVQLSRLESEFAPARVALAKRYRQHLHGMADIRLLDTDLGAVVPHIQPILVEDGRRDSVREYLERQGIATGIHYKPNHLLSLYGGGGVSLPLTESLYEALLTLPLHPELTLADVDRVCEALAAALAV